MLPNETFRKSLNAFTTDMLKSFKKTFIIVFSILAGLALINLIVFASIKMYSPDSTLSSSTGILNVGFNTMLIVLSIAFFVSTSRSEIFTQFVWPINRKVYAAGNFLTMLACALISVSGVSVLLLLETIGVKIFGLFLKDFTLINSINFQNFTTGFWVSFCYIILAASFSYCLGMYFFRRKIISAAVVIILMNLANIPIIKNLYFKIFMFSIWEQTSVFAFSIKIWLVIMLFHALSYIPLKRMEVSI